MRSALATYEQARPPRRIAGRPASAGFAMGRISVLKAEIRMASIFAGVAEERKRLAEAVAATQAAKALLASSAEGEAAEMLAFQTAMLEDEALSEPLLPGSMRRNGGGCFRRRDGRGDRRLRIIRR